MQQNVRFGALLALALLLSACPAPRKPAPPPEQAPVEQPAPPAPEQAPTVQAGAVEHRILADESLVRILVYRGGKLASSVLRRSFNNPALRPYGHSVAAVFEKAG